MSKVGRLYMEELNVILSIGNVELLVQLWRQSHYQDELGREVRERITAYLPQLIKLYDLPPSNTFREFVEAYDEKMYTLQCNKSPEECLKFFAEKGDLRNVKIAIKKGANNLNAGMFFATGAGHLEIVKFLVEKGASDLNGVLLQAAWLGKLEIVKFLVEKGASDLNRVLLQAADAGHLHVVEFLVENSADDLNKAIEIATTETQLGVVDFLEKKRDGLI